MTDAELGRVIKERDRIENITAVMPLSFKPLASPNHENGEKYTDNQATRSTTMDAVRDQIIKASWEDASYFAHAYSDVDGSREIVDLITGVTVDSLSGVTAYRNSESEMEEVACITEIEAGIMAIEGLIERNNLRRGEQ